jgi:DNA repair exonuclease SbcCD ATPase subunit
MPFMKTKLLVLLLWLVAGGYARGEGAAPVVNEYGKKSAELRNLETKINDATNQINAAIEAKDKTEDLGQQHVQMDAMVKAHKEYRDLTDKYNKLRLELKYRFPAHGAEIEGRYKQHTARSLEELNHANALEAQLAKTKKAIDKKYAPLTGPPEAPPPPTPAQPRDEKPLKVEAEQPSLRLER